MVFLFGAGDEARTRYLDLGKVALNQEVRQGSCEWLCHSWDAGSESSLVTFLLLRYAECKQQNLWTITKRNTIRQDGVFFLECRGQA